ncbi:hypothetical protein [Streptomyces sp. NPDC005125]
MSEIEELLDELRKLPSTTPNSVHELVEILVRFKSVAGRWADILYDVRQSAAPLAGPRSAAALEIAFRKAEESYVELEIAHRDVQEMSGERR